MNENLESIDTKESPVDKTTLEWRDVESVLVLVGLVLGATFLITGKTTGYWIGMILLIISVMLQIDLLGDDEKH